ncbi:MAG: sulfatase-like hydrolase/transferase [Bacteriovorax sp.]|nr:sulfatase-like hydrolase/transferase [Bacteriovorax sp.]
MYKRFTQNMYARKKYFVSIVALLSLVGIFIFIQKNNKRKRYNVLVLSTCSLSTSRLSVYNSAFHSTPNVDKLAEESYVFNNAITDMSWSNVSGFLSRIPSSNLVKNGYHAIGLPWSKEEIAWQQINGKNIPEYYMNIPNNSIIFNNMPRNYLDGLQFLKKKLQDKKNWPFLIEVHNKIIHLPYAKQLGPGNHILKLISPKSQSYIEEYIENFDKYPERVPFSLYVMERKKTLTEAVIKTLKLDNQIAKSLKEKKYSPTFIGILNNRSILAKWKSSSFFETDLNVIKETYDKMLEIYDSSIEELLKLYNDKELAENTVLIFTGDHGEAFFQHEYMAHGETVFDEMIKFPLFIKFPGQHERKIINAQFYQQGIANIVNKIIEGKINEENFEEYIQKENNHPLIYSRNCANDIKSIRYKNKWKFVWNLKNEKKFLYDLINDPDELRDVYDKNPEITSFLEENVDEIAMIQIKNKMVYPCREETE